MTNRFTYREKRHTYLFPILGGSLGFLIGISGVFNHLILEQTENVIKSRLVEAPREVTTLSFTGFRVLFLTYVGMSTGLVVSNRFNSRNKSQQKT